MTIDCEILGGKDMTILNQLLRMLEWIVYKLTSGRFLLSLMAGIGLLMMEKAILDILLLKASEGGGITATEILAFASTIFVVIQSVFMSYFNMKRESDSLEIEKHEKHPDDLNRPIPPVYKD